MNSNFAVIKVNLSLVLSLVLLTSCVSGKTGECNKLIRTVNKAVPIVNRLSSKTNDLSDRIKNNPEDLATDLRNTAKDLEVVTSELTALTSTDATVIQFRDQYLKDLQKMRTELQNLAASLDSKNRLEFTTAAQALGQTGSDITFLEEKLREYCTPKR